MATVNVYTVMNTTDRLSRREALVWVNQMLDIKINKIEDLATGAHFCEIFNAIFPGAINLKLVKFETILEHEIIQNYKILQRAFNAKRVNRALEIEKLAKGSVRYLLDLIVWFKKFYEANLSNLEHDPLIAQGGRNLDSVNVSSRKAVPEESHSLRSTQSTALKSGRYKRVSSSWSSEVYNRAPSRLEALRAEAQRQYRCLRKAEKERELLYEKIQNLKLIVYDYGKEHEGIVNKILDILFESNEGNKSAPSTSGQDTGKAH